MNVNLPPDFDTRKRKKEKKYTVGKWKVVEYGEDYKVKIVEYGEDYKVKDVEYGEGCDQLAQYPPHYNRLIIR